MIRFKQISLVVCNPTVSCTDSLKAVVPNAPIGFRILSTQAFLVNEGYNLLKSNHGIFKKGNMVSLLQTSFTAQVAFTPVDGQNDLPDFQDFGDLVSLAQINPIDSSNLKRFYIRLFTNKHNYTTEFQVEHAYNQSGSFEVKLISSPNDSNVYDSVKVGVSPEGKFLFLGENNVSGN